MSNATTAETHVPIRSASPIAGWLLSSGGLFLAGGMLHPDEDRPEVSMAEQLRVMYEDPTWYPAHTLMLVGVALIAAALVDLVRRRSLVANRLAHLACRCRRRVQSARSVTRSGPRSDRNRRRPSTRTMW